MAEKEEALILLSEIRDEIDNISRDDLGVGRGDVAGWAKHDGYFEGIDYALGAIERKIAEISSESMEGSS